MSTPQAPRSEDLSLSAFGTARATITGTPLSAKGVERLNAFWRARDFLALGIYLPPDASCLLSVANHCLRSESYVIVSDKQLHLQYLDIDAAIAHCTKGIGIWAWASNDQGEEPGVVVACAGDFPMLEALAATSLLRSECPDLKLRFVNVVDVQIACRGHVHKHGIDAAEIADWQWPF